MMRFLYWLGVVLVIASAMVLASSFFTGEWHDLPWPNGTYYEPTIIERNNP